MTSSQPAPTPLTRIAQALGDGSAAVAGVLSGTSVDGIDVALVRFGAMQAGQPVPKPELLAFQTRDFPEPLGSRLRAFIAGSGERGRGPRDAAYLHRDLGLAFGAAARASAEEHGLALDLVGSHGQTVWHHDGTDAMGAMSAQFGEGDHVAAAARAPVVSDFRCADIAAGGEGAPISALVDDVLFDQLARPAAILNLGGIANLTLLKKAPDGSAAPPRAFDVGPAGALLDGLARARLDLPFDRDGEVASSGVPDEALVAKLLEHTFFQSDPPKTTGRDTFGQAYLESVLALGQGHSDADLLASASRAVGRSILAALELWGPAGPGQGAPKQLVVAGGGVHHRPLLGTLVRGFSGQVVPAESCGVDPDAREAICFAMLAARFVRAEPSTQGSATGARSGHVLGKFSPWH